MNANAPLSDEESRTPPYLHRLLEVQQDLQVPELLKDPALRPDLQVQSGPCLPEKHFILVNEVSSCFHKPVNTDETRIVLFG